VKYSVQKVLWRSAPGSYLLGALRIRIGWFLTRVRWSHSCDRPTARVFSGRPESAPACAAFERCGLGHCAPEMRSIGRAKPVSVGCFIDQMVRPQILS